MIRYSFIVILFFCVSNLLAQNAYSRKLNDSIDLLKTEYSVCFPAENISIYNDTLAITRESNGVAGEGTIIPLQSIGCLFDGQKIIFTCIPGIEGLDKCIKDYVILMNNGGTRESFKDSFEIRLYPGSDTEPLKKVAGTLMYIVKAIQEK